jgi:hypothetical protein
VNAAAREVLGPLGLVQIGRSRLWIDDRGWWVIVVEFQPSAFAKGSFLNVGAMWLWYAKDHWSFDVGHRVEPFAEFQSTEQFQPVARQLAERAAREVAGYREMFGSVDDVAIYCAAEASRSIWSRYHAALSAGLAGDAARSSRFFAELAGYSANYDWEKEVQGRAAALSKCLPEPSAFRAAVTQVVLESRTLHKLPRLDAVDYE